ncbi:acyl-CoA reductase [Jeotgalibacillus soli]|uniref:Acyl-CoA reductase superfamily protein n=1 Tax=Jeotgalibacillus soli TaxID=889306 RepID=A0A0C2W1E0_9BACL|nr:acyl-CoA reductase [Jeotgalibacillus soli]KIL49938.1 acyl-CoA reductase superfamily protein [Jeotgalibacillus soli]
MRLFWPESNDWKTILNNMQKKELLTPFHPDVLLFVQGLSKRFLRLRHYPELMALGYWLRKAHIHEMKESWHERTNGQFIRARGTIFHLAPSNVDTIFVYSWMLSLLAGNRNVLRLSSKEQPQTNELLSVMMEILQDPEHAAVAERTMLLTYGHDDHVTAYLSERCHTRVVWGGDETVKAIRKIPLAPMANELVFPDRFSLAVLNAEVVMNANQEEKQQLLQQFYNDSFWFDQMACSSPRLIIWTGTDEAVESSQREFWPSFERIVHEKEYELMAAVQVQKLATGLWLAAEPESKQVQRGISYSRIFFDHIPAKVRERHCGGGLFFECKVSDLRGVSSTIVDKDQTLAYFGYSKEELIKFASAVSARGIDRIVPIGQALNFDGVWDGQNFLQSFTREVVII